MKERENLLSETEEKEGVRINTLACATLEGVQARRIEVEATFTKGLPGFSVVGLASNDIQESKERVKAALQTNGFVFPPLKITVNLAPSDLKKSGTHFDLPIALLIAMNDRSFAREDLYIFGELGLDGRVKSSSLLFPLILSLREQGLIRRAMVPAEAMAALSHIPGVDFLPVATLDEAIGMLEKEEAEPVSERFDYDALSLEVGGERYYYREEYPEDFREVKGQEVAKRAALIAAAGMHNYLMEGSPGCGKSMIAKRLRHILPPMSERELLAVAKHQFLDGQEPDFRPLRPFRSPHHTATSASIFGGGSHGAKIGEVALAHHGLLFFDEIPHFQKNVLEALREPMQDRQVHIARVHSKVSYDADFMFLAAMNPCPCGNLLSKSHGCRCSESEIRRYRSRLSDPFLDRIDLFVTMQEVSAEDRPGTDSKEMHRQVVAAFVRQKERAQPRPNGKLSEKEVEEFCTLDPEAQKVLDQAIARFALSHRSIVSVKKVARSIADLEGAGRIGKKHLLEALSYRRRK
ncbi:YifB family Mg chelatase-like AAA ATPase [Nitratifractor sp.]